MESLDQEEDRERTQAGPSLVMAQFGGGLVGGIAGIPLGAAIGFSLCSDDRSGTAEEIGNEIDCFTKILSGSLLGGSIGTAGGIHFVDRQRNFPSSFWITLGTATLGTGLAIGLSTPFIAFPWAIYVIYPSILTLTGIVGSHVSASHTVKKRRTAELALKPRLTALNSHGVQVEILQGRF